MNIVNLIKSILTYTNISAQQQLATGGEDNQGEVFFLYSSLLKSLQLNEEYDVFTLEIWDMNSSKSDSSDKAITNVPGSNCRTNAA